MSNSSVAPAMDSVCRSVIIAGRRTSIRMEREFWNGLDHIRAERGLSMDDVLEQALPSRQESNKTAAIKTWVLAYYRQSEAIH